MNGLDEKDLEILRILQQDGRASHVAIGKEIGLTGPSVYSRVQRLEQNGTIRTYAAQLDANKIGQGLLAFVRVLTQAVALKDEGVFERFVLSTPQILECHDTDGEDSYLLKLRVASLEELRLLVNQLRAQPTVVKTVTNIAMVTVKESGLTSPILEGDHA